MIKPYLISITGGSGSGKTTIIDKLRTSFDFEPSILSMDNYYLPKSHQKKDHNDIWNFDLPSAFDLEAFYRDILDLLNGEMVSRDEYIFENFDQIPNSITTLPSPLLIIEGIFVLFEERIRELVDFEIYIHVDQDKRLKRRLKRDSESRGLSLEMIQYQWDNHVCPAHDKWVEPHRSNADIILNNTVDFGADLARCVELISEKLEDISQA
ncbi:MAG: uridine kinase [Bacteroidota bacterium]